ncbi:predicted protein [Plenodomus lingam JN3]|uniref:Predicted protein n=1 Tax=Leptosphaeria maculans (strain JN3 / isolate v23.1.3 / race Av1-4-5-6-7-8) TaxID=985895 RepID=E5AEH8_LEPMJ|nr:predicted protein [Plenodomus lingam JN3]CBY01617.1 predicted protein [Plenodomus lingam JN3]
MPPESPPTTSPLNPTTHPTPRTTLLSTTFWEVLPSHQTRITTRLTKIAYLHSQTHTCILATDRAAALASLKAEIEMLDHDISALRAIIRGIDITDLAGLYVVAGRSAHRALQLAKGDLEGLEGSLRGMEERHSYYQVLLATLGFRSHPPPDKTSVASMQKHSSNTEVSSETSSNLDTNLVVLGERADRILASLHVLQSMDQKAPKTRGRVEQMDFAEIILLHTELLENDLRTIRDSADIFEDEHVAAWIDSAVDNDEKACREIAITTLLQKLGELKKEMADASVNILGHKS